MRTIMINIQNVSHTNDHVTKEITLPTEDAYMNGIEGLKNKSVKWHCVSHTLIGNKNLVSIKIKVPSGTVVVTHSD